MEISMLKKVISLMLLFICAINLYGCNNSQNIIDEGKNNTSEKSINKISDKTIKDLSLTGFSWDNFNIETDDPVFMSGYHEIALSDKGYYFIHSEILYFMDKSSNKCIPLCSKPDCSHEGKDLESCNAYFNFNTFDASSGLFYYNSNLYILGNDGNGENGLGKGLYLYRISYDGTKRERVCHLLDISSSASDMGLRIIIHRGIVYLSYSEENKSTLCSFSINDNKAELKTIDTMEGKSPEFYRLKGYGDYLVYQYFYYDDENLDSFSGGIKVFDGKNKQVLIKDAIKSYCISDSKVYYETSDGIKIYDLKSKKTSDFKAESDYFAINCDGEYFYTYNSELDSSYEVNVYDKKYNKINSFKSLEGYGELCFGDEKYFFTENKYFNKSDLRKKNVQWKNITDKYYNIEQDN